MRRHRDKYEKLNKQHELLILYEKRRVCSCGDGTGPMFYHLNQLFYEPPPPQQWEKEELARLAKPPRSGRAGLCLLSWQP